jgi:NAD(P)-dependent dehydrogenase (short-subunit alcohol dehydrogenase family)
MSSFVTRKSWRSNNFTLKLTNLYRRFNNTMASNSVVLILGAGPRVGASVTEKFASKGYKVALASRKGTDSKTDQGYLSLKADFTKPDSIPALFDAVKAEFGTSPNVVIYNAATLTPPPDANSVLSIASESVARDLNVNTISPYVAAQQAISGWETLPAETKKSFIYTGNILNVAVLPVPLMLNLGIGKSASAYWIGVADATYAAKGYR